MFHKIGYWVGRAKSSYARGLQDGLSYREFVSRETENKKLIAEMIDLMKQDKRVNAIKLCKTRKNLSLADAVAFYNTIVRAHPELDMDTIGNR